MLMTSVVLYLLLSVAVGLFVARKVKTSTDYAVAGRHLGLPIVIATVFATWFGSETVLGISSTFVEGGLSAIVADPFGASFCLILAGLFFAPRLYRLKLLTIGDFYRLRYGQVVEVLCSVCIIVSYLGWVAAQISALGLIFHVLSDGAVSRPLGMVLGTSVVLLYTLFGGMLSVAVMDFIQMTVIGVGLLFIAWLVSDMAGGVGAVVAHADAAGKLQFFPEEFSYVLWVPFVGAFLTMAFGSIPQQDVFQRITSAKNEQTASRGAIIGGTLYLGFAFIPLFLAYAAVMVKPEVFGPMVTQDSQMVLPTFILQYTPLWAQILFFGALISAIMSTASATLLAPSVSFAENIYKVMFPNISDKKFLMVMRLSVLVFTGIVLSIAINSNASIFEMVESAYEITFAAAFVPLTFGLFWKRATTQGALMSIITGISVWLLGSHVLPLSIWPPQFLGFVCGLVAMVVGSLMPQLIAPRCVLVDGKLPQQHHAHK